jgi:hypothetical protein
VKASGKRKPARCDHHPTDRTTSKAAIMDACPRVTDRLLLPLRNPDDGRLRAGWRIALMLVLYLVSTIASMGLVETLVTGTGRRLAAAFEILGVGLLAAWLPTPYLDRRPFSALGLGTDRRAAVDLAIGAILVLLPPVASWWSTSLLGGPRSSSGGSATRAASRRPSRSWS